MLGFIQKKAEKIFPKKGRDGNIFFPEIQVKWPKVANNNSLVVRFKLIFKLCWAFKSFHLRVN